MQLIVFLINLILGSYVTILLLRLLLQKANASWYNPITRLCLVLTNPVIKPLRRVIPGVAGFDLSIIAFAWVLACIQITAVVFILYELPPHVLGVVLYGLLSMVSSLFYIYIAAIIVFSISSWFVVSQRHPLIEIVTLLSSPILSRLQRVVPTLSGIDFSPFIAIIGIYIISNFLLHPLLAYTLRLVLFKV